MTGLRGLLLLALATAAGAQDFHVDQASGDDSFDGLSWSSPKCTIQAAVDATTGLLEATIHVAEGTYRESVTWRNQNISLIGGYAMAGGPWDPDAHRTVLDGDDLRRGIQALATNQSDATTVLRGLTLRRMIPRAIEYTGGNLEITRCVIEHNSAVVPEGGVSASTVALNVDYAFYPPGLALIEDCVFRRNAQPSVGRDDRLWRGFLHLVNAGSATFRRCVFEGNDHEALGFRDISADPGVGNVILEDVRMDAARSSGSRVRLHNVLVRRDFGFGHSYRPYNCDFFNVTAGSLTIVRTGFDRAPTIIRDSIILGEIDGIPVPAISGIASEFPFLDVADSLVRGGWPAGTRILDADPLLTSGPLGDHYLSHVAAGDPATSPAVDLGSRDASAAALDTATTRVDSVGDMGTVDMGYHYPAFPGDLVIRRAQAASTLAPHATTPRLPWLDAPGTASDPAMPLLFYEVPGATNELMVTRDATTDALLLDWR